MNPIFPNKGWFPVNANLEYLRCPMAVRRQREEEICDWCAKVIGKAGYDWKHIGITTSWRFKAQEHAALFAITWS